MEGFIKDWGYLALFLYTFGGGFIGLIFAGILAYAGDLNIYICMLVAGTANFLGDQFLFTMARKHKDYAKKMMKKHGRKVALAQVMMRKRGSLVIFIQKYIYGIKTLVPLAMGLTKYSAGKFIIINLFASALWAIVVGSASYFSGEYILGMTDNLKYASLAIVGIVLLSVTYFLKKI